MTVQEQFYTVEQFDEFVELPENTGKLFEFIGGEIVEVPSNAYVSYIAALILTKIMTFVLSKKLGYVTGEAGGYIVAGERYAPDVAFISYERQPELAKSGYNPNPPDLAVEVISSGRTEEQTKLRIKVSNYLSVGTVVWVVNPESRSIEVHVPGAAVKIYRGKDTLAGEPVLPDLQIKLTDIFTEEK